MTWQHFNQRLHALLGLTSLLESVEPRRSARGARSRTGIVIGGIVMLGAATIAPAGPSAEFIFLPPAQPDFIQTSMQGLDADGAVAVGGVPMPASYCAFRWTQSEGMVSLDNLVDDDHCWAHAYAMSADGTTIVGESQSPQPDIGSEAVLWTAQSGAVGLGIIEPDDPDSARWSIAYGVSGDGSTVVGKASADRQAFRWTEATGMVGLGLVLPDPDPDHPYPSSTARAVSDDGSVVIGAGSPGGAFQWTEDTGMVQLYPEGGTKLESAASDLTPDGSTIVGWIENTDGSQDAVRWVNGDRLSLGSLPGYEDCRAQVVSESGEVIFGTCLNGYWDRKTFVWSSVDGMQPLTDLLEAQGAEIPANLVLSRVNGVSSDLRTVAGQTIEPKDLAGGGGFLVKLTAPIVDLPSADLTGDGSVDVADALLMLNHWGACDPGNCPADLDNDGMVGVADLLTLLSNWG